MPYFAELVNGEVVRVIVADNIQWCQSRLGGTWLTTSYNATVRKNYAGIGYKYRGDIDAFVAPQPFFNHTLSGNAKWEFTEDADVIYVPVARDAAFALSKSLYSLIEKQKEGMYCGIVPHPTRKDVATLQLRKTDLVPVALGADSSPLVEILTPFVGKEMTQEELDNIIKAIKDNAGSQVLLTDLIPASWQQYVMTREQALAAGWIA